MSSFNTFIYKGNEIERFIVESDFNPNETVKYYRIWNDGFVEQLGHVTGNVTGAFINNDLAIPLQINGIYPMRYAGCNYKNGSGYTAAYSTSFQYITNNSNYINQFHIYIRMADGQLPPADNTLSCNFLIIGYNQNYVS